MPLIFEFRKVGSVKKMPSVRMVLLHENGLRENLRHSEQNAKIELYKSEGKRFNVTHEYCYYNKEKDTFEMIEEQEVFKNPQNYMKFVPKPIENSPDKEVRPLGMENSEWKIYCVGIDL